MSPPTATRPAHTSTCAGSHALLALPSGAREELSAVKEIKRPLTPPLPSCASAAVMEGHRSQSTGPRNGRSADPRPAGHTKAPQLSSISSSPGPFLMKHCCPVLTDILVGSVASKHGTRLLSSQATVSIYSRRPGCPQSSTSPDGSAINYHLNPCSHFLNRIVIKISLPEAEEIAQQL